MCMVPVTEYSFVFSGFSCNMTFEWNQMLQLDLMTRSAFCHHINIVNKMHCANYE